MSAWTKMSYGTGPGHWTLSNGHMQFDVHLLIDGSGRRDKYPDRYIVTPKQADGYAEWILNVLNEAEKRHAHYKE